MSTFLHPTQVRRSTFHKLAVRQQFTFSAGTPAGLWVKTGMNTYATPASDKHTINGKVLPCTNTGRVKYWRGNTFRAPYSTPVIEVYPAEVMTEAVMRDW